MLAKQGIISRDDARKIWCNVDAASVAYSVGVDMMSPHIGGELFYHNLAVNEERPVHVMDEVAVRRTRQSC